MFGIPPSVKEGLEGEHEEGEERQRPFKILTEDLLTQSEGRQAFPDSHLK